MVLAMYVGMLIYMPLEGQLPSSFQQIGMALFMAWPMVVWMRIRGHGWRHGLEMSAAMLIPGAALLVLANAIPPLAGLAEWAMYLGMLGFMLLRRNNHHHAAMHHHSEPHSTSHPVHNRRFHFRPFLLAVAYFTAVVLVFCDTQRQPASF
jgi:flagellar biosynthetic protein FliP